MDIFSKRIFSFCELKFYFTIVSMDDKFVYSSNLISDFIVYRNLRPQVPQVPQIQTRKINDKFKKKVHLF